MKKPLFLSLLALFAWFCAGAKSYDFTVASLNVDGMPPSLLSGVVKLNPDANEAYGADEIGKAIARHGWDYIALSEDFNYHSDLMAPLSQYYFSGTYRGNLYNKLDVLTSPFDTDGLGFLWKKTRQAGQESWTMWNKRNGKTDSGSDELIKKGFRYYMITVAPGVEIDVYTLHMDAETNAEDNAARESQMAQLVSVIKNTKNGRPIIIMGDTNCRYTRDNIKGLLKGALEEDSRFTFHDPWVELYWAEEGGFEAPQLQVGQPSIMNNSGYGEQKGEIVDKIFYLNNSDSFTKLECTAFECATDFIFQEGEKKGEHLSDHFPVVAHLTAVVPDGIVAGTEYFLRNKKTGKYLNQGADWGTQAVIADYGNRIKMEQIEENKFYLISTAGYIKSALYLDGSADDRGEFITADTKGGCYSITVGGKYLTAPATGNVVTANEAYTEEYSDWEILTIDDLKDELMDKASETNPMDATFFIRGAGVNRNDGDNSNWKLTPRDNSTTSIGTGDVIDADWNIDLYNKSPGWGSSSKTQWNLEQTCSGLPNGKYVLTFNGFTTTSIERLNINGKGIDIHKINTTIDSNVANRHNAAKGFYADNLYQNTVDLTITDGSLVFDFYKNTNSSETWTNFDNFRLTYYGQTEDMLKAKNRLKEALDDAATWVEKFDNSGKSHYNNALIEQAYAAGNVSESAEDEVKKTYEALATAAKSQTTAGADMTPAINNWSFEMGWMTYDRNHPYWCSKWTSDTSVHLSGEEGSTYYVDNTDGLYLFNTWGENAAVNGPIAQDISGLPNGIYKITASVTSFADNKLYVFGNGVYSPVPGIAKGQTHFEDVEVEVTVTDGTLCLGAVAAFPDRDPVIAIKSAQEVWGDPNANDENFTGCWFKADNFRLTYVTSLNFSLLQEAIDEAKGVAEKNNLSIDLSAYQQMVDERNVPTDLDPVVSEIFDKLAAEVKKQTAVNSDMTYAILDHSFENTKYGTYLKNWTTSFYNDTKIVEANNESNKGTYGVDRIDGKYLFNTWDGDDKGYAITQTIEGVPAGKYRLEAMVTSHDGRTVTLYGCGSTATITTKGGSGVMTDASLEFEYDGITNFTIGTTDGNWYKVDNFRLTLLEYIAPTTITWKWAGGKYDAIMLPFDAELPEDLDYVAYSTSQEKVVADNKDGFEYHVIKLTEEGRSLKANTPYIVKRDQATAASLRAPRKAAAASYGDDETVLTFTGYPTNDKDTYTDGVLTGTHVNKEVPAAGHLVLVHNAGESWFTDNTETATVEASKAYISDEETPDFSFNRNTAFIDEPIEDLEVVGIEDVIGDTTVVDVYTISGTMVATGVESARALDNLNRGVYILRSATRAVKVAK